MQFWTIWFSATALLFGFCTAAEVPKWASEEPSEWPEDYPQCSGDKQSPITLDQINSTWKQSDYEIKFENTDNKGKVFALNNGFYAIFNYTYPSKSETPRVIISHSEDSSTYYVQNANFRWPKEHEIPDKPYVLELHIYAVNEKKEGVVIVYPLNTDPPFDCDGSSCPTDCRNDTALCLTKETSAALNMTNAGDEVTLTDDDITHLLPEEPGCGYYTYKGSITVPPCTEGTLWLVYKEVLCVEKETVEAFYSLKDSDGEPIKSNERGLQERNGRTIVDFACDKN